MRQTKIQNKYKNMYDSHMHTRHSQDGCETVDAICARAVAMGLKGIALTDHCDIDLGERACMSVKKNLIADACVAREKYGDRLDISIGAELGEPHHNLELARAFAEDDALDFVLGSLHRLRGMDDFYFLRYDRLDLDDLFKRYYDELLELAETAPYDSVAHINYQVRYMSAPVRRSVNFADYYDRLDEILHAIASRECAMELNSSGGRKNAELIPSSEVLQRFRACGGRYLTIGSDAHVAQNVGQGIDDAMDAARDAGYEAFVFFKKRVPQVFAIE